MMLAQFTQAAAYSTLQPALASDTDEILMAFTALEKTDWSRQQQHSSHPASDMDRRGTGLQKPAAERPYLS